MSEKALVAKAQEVFAQAPVNHLIGTSEDLTTLRDHLMAYLTKADLARAATPLSTIKAKLAGASGAVSVALAAFVESELGREGLAADRIVTDYARLIAELRRWQGLNPEMAFWRCFASTWQLQKQEVLAELIEQLSGLGIEPLGALERVPLVVERREVGVSVVRLGSVGG